MRFRKSVKVCKGVKLNVSKSGASLTVSPFKGVSLNMGGNGAFFNWSIPGTGVYDRVRIDTLLKDKLGGLFGAKQEEQEEERTPAKRSSSKTGGRASAKASGRASGGKAQGRAGAAKKSAGVSEAELERVAHQEALIAIGRLTPKVSARATGEMDAEKAEQAIEKWLEDAQAPVEIAVQTEAVPEKRLVMVDLDLPEIEDMPDDKLTQLADGTVKLKKKSQKELRGDYKTCAFGLGQFVAGHVFTLVPAAKKVAVSAYTTRRSDKTGEAEDVFIYSVVYERDKMTAVAASEDPCAACDALRSRYVLLASGLLKPIAPYEAAEIE